MKKLLLIAALFAFPAYAADPMVACLSGCKNRAMLKAAPDAQIGDAWWFGPSVGLALAARDNATGKWESNIAFQFQYGIKWQPSWWSATRTFLSFDLGFQAGTTDVTSPQFALTLAPTITVLDIIAVGYGPRFHLSGQTSVSGVLFLGLSTSFGGP